MKPRKLSAAILFLLFVVAYSACKKTDSVPEKPTSKPGKFFDLPSDAPKQLRAVSAAIKGQNERHHFLASVIKSSGYPVWDKARVVDFNSRTMSGRGSGEATGEVVYIPFVRDSDHYVNSVLAVKLEPSDTIYRMIHDYNYRRFGYDTTDPTKWSARDVFNIFSSFDHSVFGHNRFWIRDKNLLGIHDDSLQVTATRTSGDGGRNVSGKTGMYAVEECQTWEVCEKAADGSGGSGGGLPARTGALSGEDCINTWYIDICTTYYYDDGSGGDGSTGDGDGTGDPSTGSGGGGAGWYDGGDDPCSGSGGVIQRNAIVAPDDCGSGWEPLPSGGGPTGTVSSEFDPSLPAVDPDEQWWNDNSTTFPPQNLPSWDNINSHYPKDANGNDMPADDVYNLIGGDILVMKNANPDNFRNACAARVSRALNYSGVTIPSIPNHTFKGGDGKYYFLSAAKLYNWMVKTFGTSNAIVLNQNQGGSNGSQFQPLLSGKKGIFLMKPASIQSFGATGHATLYNGSGCVGGVEHCYFDAEGGVAKIVLFKLN